MMTIALNSTENGTERYWNDSAGPTVTPFVHPVPLPVRTTVIAIISGTVIVSNIINLATLRRTKQIPRISRLCLMNLSTADLCVGLIACAPCVYPAVTGVWPYGIAWCQVAGIVHGMSCAVSIWSISVVSVDRYVAVTKPLAYHSIMTVRRCYVILLLLWLCAFATFATPLLIESPLFTYYRYSEEEVMCGLYWKYPWFCIATGIYIPMLSAGIVIFTSVRISQAIKKSVQTRREMSTNVRKINSFDRKAVRILATTAGAYLTYWGPYSTLVIAHSFSDTIQATPLVSFILIWIANSNSCINVFIYSAMNAKFRENAKNLIIGFFSCNRCGDPKKKQKEGTDSTDSSNKPYTQKTSMVASIDQNIHSGNGHTVNTITHHHLPTVQSKSQINGHVPGNTLFPVGIGNEGFSGKNTDHKLLFTELSHNEVKKSQTHIGGRKQIYMVNVESV